MRYAKGGQLPLRPIFLQFIMAQFTSVTGISRYDLRLFPERYCPMQFHPPQMEIYALNRLLASEAMIFVCDGSKASVI
jgi:hypothetical protein